MKNSVVKTSLDELNFHNICKYKISFKKNTRITITVFHFKFSNVMKLKIACATLATM
jgi:intergrase/recombinase